MRCSKCDSDNREGRKFCTNRGAPLIAACSKCGAAFQPGERFCGECGAALSDALATKAEKAEPIAGSAIGERRHLTVLFCDLVGSTEIAARLDPEEWREMVASYHRAVAEAITRFSGSVAKYLGDGVMAFFGYPEAHDNDAERAARAGLAILDVISKLNEQAGRPQLAARVGIDSGAVVVGAGAGKDADVFGDTPNIAARVQTAADPGTVLITEDSNRLMSGLFVVEDRPTQALKGLNRSVKLYRIIRPSKVRGRLEAAAEARGLTAFVGRQDELRSLIHRWEQVRDSQGQAVLIIGEAGIGKSRLVQRFREHIQETPHTWIEAAASPFFQNTPFYPVAEMVRELLAWRTPDQPGEQLAQLESGVEIAGLRPTEAVPLIAPLINLPLPANYPQSPLSAEQQRRRLLATLVEWVLGIARRRPLIIATEDLHWADPSTLELIQLLVEQRATARLLLLYTARPEFRTQWPLRAHHIHIALSPLNSRDVRTMVEQVAAHRALSKETIATVVERTAGVPLFVEELTLAVLESGNAKRSGHEIPVTLHDSLMARLDRLGPANEVAQIGAVIGREFSYDLLHALYPGPEDKLQDAIRTLADAELLYVRGIPPESTYTFKHALIQDAAYEALLKARRRELHQSVARVLSRQFSELTERQPELLAHHYTEAGLNVEAVPCWRRAGQGAVERSAHVEAVSHLTKGLELLNTLPDSPERAREELTLLRILGTSQLATKGWGAPQVEATYMRARELCRQVGETAQVFPVLSGLFTCYVVQTKLRAALELGKQLLKLAQQEKQPALLVEAHRTLGIALFCLGDFASSREHSEQGFSFYDAERHRTLAFSYGQDPGVFCLSNSAFALWHLGYPDQALTRSEEALTLAQSLSHPFSLSYALQINAMVHQLRGEQLAAQERTEAFLTLSTEQGFQWCVGGGIMLLGWAVAEQGQRDEGIAQSRRGLEVYLATGAKVWQPYYLALLAQEFYESGRLEEGLNVLAEALDVVNTNDERWYEAELYRLKGEFLLVQNASSAIEAEYCFRLALGIARKQRAKSLELRATMSLARLLAKQSRREETRAMLGEIYNWFTEGFDTANLTEAKALLEELRA